MNQACLNFGGDDLSAYAEFRCVEPLRKLVTTEKTADGKRYVNPSRLVMGTNADLKVGVKGEFSAENVEWRVVSGPGRIVATNGWCATVEPTGANEDVIVEARFSGRMYISLSLQTTWPMKEQFPWKVWLPR